MMMGSNNHSNSKDLIQFFSNQSLKNEINQIFAKALFTELNIDSSSIRWNYIPNRILRNLVYVTLITNNIFIKEEDNLVNDELLKIFKETAVLWENLGILKENISKSICFLNAAIYYELSGYQANSMCLMKKIDTVKDEHLILRMIKYFLERKYFNLLFLCNKLLQPPDVLENFEYKVITSSVANFLRKLIISLFQGDDQLWDEAYISLKKILSALNQMKMINEYNILSSFLFLLPIIRKRSIKTTLEQYFSSHIDKFKRYIKILARGTNLNIYGSKSILELWPSQISAIENGLLSSNSSKIIRMPTSAGKTRIAEISIIHYLIHNPEKKALYIAPFNSLALELEDTFSSIFNDMGFIVSRSLGYDIDDFEEKFIEEANLLILTHEKVNILLRIKPEFFEEIGLIILDEYQIISDQERGIKYEFLISRIKKLFPETRFICISAVVSDETISNFMHWLNCNNKNDAITSNWRPAIQHFAVLKATINDFGKLQFLSDIQNHKFPTFLPHLIEVKKYRFTHPDTKRIRSPRFPEIESKAQISVELAYNFVESGSVLIFCPRKPLVKAVGKAFLNKLDYMRWSNINLPHSFNNVPNNYSILLSQDWYGGNHIITKLLKFGIAIHYGDMPRKLKEAIENDFRNNKYKIIICTSTLAQGVNLPIKTVIFHSFNRYDPIEGLKDLSINEYWNIAGRAGRASKETSGLIINIEKTPRDRRLISKYFTNKNRYESITSAILIKLRDYINSRLSEDDFIFLLDSEILAYVIEEGIESKTEDEIFSELNEVLLASHQMTSSEKLDFRNIIKKAIKKSISIYPSLRKIYYRTGFSIDSCDMIKNFFETNKKYILNIVSNPNYDDIEDFISLFLPLCLSLPELRNFDEYEGSIAELLVKWINGTSIDKLLKNEENPEIIGKIIDNLFRFYLPWGFSSCIRMMMDYFKVEKEDVSPILRFFPTMVKYGLPNPISCWGFSIGIPIRDITINFAAEFEKKCNQKSLLPNFQNYMRWIYSLSSDDLINVYGLNNFILEDVAKQLFSKSKNIFLQGYKNIESFLPIQTEIKGIQYENRKNVALTLKPNQNLLIERDYNNIIDKNAIRVLSQTRAVVGYIPRDIAQILAPEIDTGKEIFAKIIKIDGNINDIPKIIIELRY